MLTPNRPKWEKYFECYLEIILTTYYLLLDKPREKKMSAVFFSL